MKRRSSSAIEDLDAYDAAELLQGLPPMGGLNLNRKWYGYGAGGSFVRGIKPEVKTIDWPASSTLVTAGYQIDTLNPTAVITCVNPIAEGTSFYNRVGRNVLMKSLRVTGYFLMTTGAASGSPEWYRVLVCYDRQSNGAVIAGLSIILQDTSYAGVTTTSAISDINNSYRERIAILRDLKYGLLTANNAANTPIINQQLNSLQYVTGQTNVDLFIPMRGIESQYNNGASGTQTDIQTGAVLVVSTGLGINSGNSAQNTSAFFQWKCRIRYQEWGVNDVFSASGTEKRLGRVPVTRGLPAALYCKGPELKVMDYPSGSGPPVFGTALSFRGDTIAQAMTIVPLNVLSEGTGYYQRVGRRVCMKKLFLSGWFADNYGSGNAIAFPQYEFHKIMVLYDRQANGALPAASDILQDVSWNGTQSGATPSPFCGINMNNSERFIFLRNIRRSAITVATSSTVTNCSANICEYQMPRKGTFNLKINLKNYETRYATATPASSTDISCIASGSLLLCFLTNIASNVGYTINWKSRLAYRDMP